MNEIEVIESREVLGKDFKIYGTIENPLFLAKDVANWLENSNTSQMVRNIDEDEKVKKITPIYNVYNGQYESQECLFLTEYGLYEVLMQSRKPLAKEFKKKVKEILKTLRLNQIQITNTTNDNQINEVVNGMKEMLNMFGNLTSQFTTIMIQQNEIMKKVLDNTNIKESFMLEDIGRDEIEREILNSKNETLTIQSFCNYLYHKCIPKDSNGNTISVGIMLVNQLLQENNIFTEYNTPFETTLKFFTKDKSDYKRVLVNKNGMILLYRLINEQVDENYKLKRR